MDASRFLEVGAGRGELAAWLAKRGGRGIALEPSPYAATAARETLAPFENVDVVESDFSLFNAERGFQLITMMEILEHVEDDGALVKRAAALLEPGGRLVLSVPAHMHMWGWRDEEKGHLRRYERNDIHELLARGGLAPDMLLCWGWPFLNMLRSIDQGRSAVRAQAREATALSAVKQDVKIGPAWLLSPVVTALPFGIMDVFLGTDGGVGYIAVARKGSAA